MKSVAESTFWKGEGLNT